MCEHVREPVDELTARALYNASVHWHAIQKPVQRPSTHGVVTTSAAAAAHARMHAPSPRVRTCIARAHGQACPCVHLNLNIKYQPSTRHPHHARHAWIHIKEKYEGKILPRLRQHPPFPPRRRPPFPIRQHPPPSPRATDPQFPFDSTPRPRPRATARCLLVSSLFCSRVDGPTPTPLRPQQGRGRGKRR